MTPLPRAIIPITILTRTKGQTMTIDVKPLEDKNKDYAYPFSGAEDRYMPSSSDDAWTTACLINELTLRLCSVSVYVGSADGKTIRIGRKYYEQAKGLLYRIPVWRPTPAFVVYRTDLTAKLDRELRELSGKDDVLKEAVGCIFENLDYRYYHLNVAKLLFVKIVG
jgi:hypothetical protein